MSKFHAPIFQQVKNIVAIHHALLKDEARISRASIFLSVSVRGDEI
jgi:hypothetical protein